MSVSSNNYNEDIVLVNLTGKEIGTALKLPSHCEITPLHLAFSCYVFNDKGEFLATQRAHTKKVWPGVWTNSVCGHPAPGESMHDAINRRLEYELGMTASGIETLLTRYIYKTPPYNGIIEHEFCPVYIARATSDPQPNPMEVEAYKWMKWQDYVKQAEADAKDKFSWWCKDQLKIIKDHTLIKSYARAMEKL
jgi:isopentenyl-diphosphate Delta-isomerase